MEIKIPNVGESIKEAILVQWYKNDGDPVEKDEPLFLIETDKVTLEVAAESAGILKITVPAGQTVAIGSVVGTIEAGAKPAPAQKTPPGVEKKKSAAATVTLPAAPEPKPAPLAAIAFQSLKNYSPAVRRLAAEKNIDLDKIAGTGPGGRITKGDVILYMEQESLPQKTIAPSPQAAAATPPPPAAATKSPAFGKTTRRPMSPIRLRIADRLLEARQNTAMLTTFNEIDMGGVMDLRSRSKDAFQKKFDVSLGFMSFFIKATVAALKAYPEINASIEGTDIVDHHYYHVGVAIGSERGLVVPVIRDADQLNFAQIEQRIVDFVDRINNNRLQLSDLEGGTFTISNGGVYGSLLSTPILNIPQSGILGMHKIENRPIAVDNKVVIHPMMYVALSYDHRIVDGKGAVSFLKHIKEWIENPEDPLMET